MSTALSEGIDLDELIGHSSQARVDDIGK